MEKQTIKQVNADWAAAAFITFFETLTVMFKKNEQNFFIKVRLREKSLKN